MTDTFMAEVELKHGEEIPRIYDLGFGIPEGGAPLFCVSVEKEALETLLKRSLDKPIEEIPFVAGLEKSLTKEDEQPIGKFVFDEEHFGYDDGNVFKGIPEQGLATSYLVYHHSLKPIIEGTEKAMQRNWRYGHLVSASLNILFHLLNWLETKTNSQVRQLMLINMVTRRDRHGGEMDVVLSRSVRGWLENRLNQGHLDKIRERMLAAAMILDPLYFAEDEDYRQSNIRVTCDGGGRIVLDVPGDACGLYVPGYKHFRPGKGWEFETHNCDNPIQQLTLLAGLATLHQLMRADGL